MIAVWLSKLPWRKCLLIMILTVVGIPLVYMSQFPIIQWAVGPSYELTVRNNGQLAITGGRLEGDRRLRPVGRIAAGTEELFTFSRTGAKNAEYTLKLVREDRSEVVCHIGWLPEEWDISAGSHDRLVVPDDTCRVARTDVERAYDEYMAKHPKP